MSEQYANEHRDEAEAIDQERDRDAEGPDRQAGDGRAEHPRAVEHRRVEADGVADVLPADHLDRERLAGRHVDRVRTPEDAARTKTSRPGRRRSRSSANSEEADDHRDDLRHVSASGAWAAASAITPPNSPKTSTGRTGTPTRAPARTDRRSAGGRASPGRPLHPRADRARWLAAEEQSVVAVAEGAGSPGTPRIGPRARHRTSGRCHRRRARPAGPQQVARRSSASPTMAARRPDLRPEDARSGGPPGRGRRRRAPAARRGRRLGEGFAVAGPGGLVLEHLADLGEANPASSRRSLMNRSRSTSVAS